MSARVTVLLGLNASRIVEAISRHVDAALPDALALSSHFPEIAADGRPMHPSAVPDVADRLLGLTATYGRPLVVCTHSDVFVLRLRRRIAEGALKPSDVALVWVEQDGTEKPIPLNDRGTPEWWPEGVHAESQAEFHAMRRALNARDIAGPHGIPLLAAGVTVSR